MEWVKELKAGDEVFWNDPDDGACSRYLTIQEISINGDVVSILDKEGNFLECFIEEVK